MIYATIAAQDGVITLAQARGHGMSPDAVERMVKSGRWRRLHLGVYQSVDHKPSAASRLRAGVFATGGVAHGLSAAWWHGLVDTAPSVHTVTIPPKRRIEAPRGVRIRRTKLDAADQVKLKGVATTTIPLTVLEVGDSILIDQVLQRGVTIAGLNRALERNARRAGMKRARALVAVAASGGRSEAERLAHRIMRPIPGWRAQLPVGPYWLDVAFEDIKLGIEVDGWRWHKDSRRNSEDLKRQNALVNAGWRLLRFDWHRLNSDPAGVLDEILELRRFARADCG